MDLLIVSLTTFLLTDGFVLYRIVIAKELKSPVMMVGCYL